MVDIVTIQCLPDEIISMVLELTTINDILSFSRTCKRFYGLVNSSQRLWKQKFKMLHPDIYGVTKKYGHGSWIHGYKEFMKQKRMIHNELQKMSPKCYWKNEDIAIHDIANFFPIAFKHNLSFYYTIIILQDLMMKVSENTKEFHTKKPFTLTEMYYARAVLRHLIHSYLCVKWISHQSENSLPPENVVNFFLQWMDPENIHFMEDVDKKLEEIADMVKVQLERDYPLKLHSNNSYTAHQVFKAVSYIFFQENHLTLTSSASLDNIDIHKIWDTKLGNQLVVFAMYQSVARRVGIYCELVVFSNHLFLEWKASESDKVYRVNIGTGQLEVKRNCPYAHRKASEHYRYNQNTMLKCLHEAYVGCMGETLRWTRINAGDLSGFILGGVGVGHFRTSPYDNVYAFLYQNIDLLRLDSNLNIQCLTNKELQIMMSLLRVEAPKIYRTSEHKKAWMMDVMRRQGSISYAVGMVCCHKVHNYVCVITGWNHEARHYRRVDTHNLANGMKQPFYDVIAADGSERYVAQENLVPIAEPPRLEHIEEFIGRQFSHFDGFCYILNEEKSLEYPWDYITLDVYRRRYQKYQKNQVNIHNDI